jgi:hypothetical protein
MLRTFADSLITSVSVATCEFLSTFGSIETNTARVVGFRVLVRRNMRPGHGCRKALADRGHKQDSNLIKWRLLRIEGFERAHNDISCNLHKIVNPRERSHRTVVPVQVRSVGMSVHNQEQDEQIVLVSRFHATCSKANCESASAAGFQDIWRSLSRDQFQVKLQNRRHKG